MKLYIFLISALLPFNGFCAVNYNHIKVVRVIDGDTVKLANGEKLRYIGIDTPEIEIKRKGKFIYRPQPFAIKAQEENQKLVEGKYVRVEFDTQRYDRYGRLLGYCFAGKEFVNAYLLRRGLAHLFIMPPNLKYADLLAAAQAQAAENKKGLWAKGAVIYWRNASEHIGKVKTIKGVIVNTGVGRKVIFLDFGSKKGKDFTVVIFKRYLKYFYQKGINPLKDYNYKEIMVTGKITKYRGRPEIIVRSPYQLAIVK